MDKDRQVVAILFGGASTEHEVSLMSATSVIENLPRDRYEPVLVGITKEGRWLLYTGPVEQIIDGSWQGHPGNRTVVLSPDRGHHGLLCGDGEVIRLDAVFPVLHGKNGEDGTIQGLLELAGIPYVGCGVTASAVCMDKAITHAMLDAAGIRTAKWALVGPDDMADFDATVQRLADKLGWPMFVKPANFGSSVGVSKAADAAGLRRALEIALGYDPKVVVEEFIDGAEVECAVLGNGDPIVSVPGEIVPCNEFYDYEAKYLAGTSELHIPARLSPEVTEQVRQTARRAYLALGCSGLTRVDFFVTRSGEVILNEPNTIPGFTSISMYPKLMGASGIPYGELIARLIELGIERCTAAAQCNTTR